LKVSSEFDQKILSETIFRIILGLLIIVLNCGIIWAQQTPYSGTPAPVPGRIEAENFDNGDEGEAYYDSDDSNSGGEYRSSSGVDIEICYEEGVAVGYNVGWINAGEWIEYTVNVAKDSMYIFEFRVASESAGGTFHFEVDGDNLTGSVQFEATGGWQIWITVSAEDIPLTKGEHILRFYAETSNFNINYVDIDYQIVRIPPVVQITAPKDNSEFESGSDILITAAASDPNGQVVKVEFYADEMLLAVDETAPYEHLWQKPPPGNYDLRAIATDNDFNSTTSERVDVRVLFPKYNYELFFSHPHGFYYNPFTLTISCNSTEITIHYTLDGSNPLTSTTAKSLASPANIQISPTSTVGRGRTPGVVVRAVGVKGNIQQTLIVTRTYIFVNEVRNQGHPGEVWPNSGVNGQSWSYNMNQSVVNDSRYTNLIDDALLDIPSISLVADLGCFFDKDSGIYVNAEYHGREWERPVSVELINPDGTEGFQIGAGIRIRGGWSRHGNYPKHAFRLFFREEYGKSKLEYPIFEDEGVTEFKKLDLRTSQNYAWSNGYIWENTMNRDVFSRDLQAQMDQPYTRSRYYHLYIDGEYWGLYQSQERPEAEFAESYLGGDEDDYDIVKVDIGEDFNLYELEATDGNLDGWQAVWQAGQTGFSDAVNYFKLEGRKSDGSYNPSGKKLVDIDNLIDYMIIIFYTGNFDAPVSKFKGETSPNNFYAIYNRNANEGFKFFAHDAEHTLLAHEYSPGIGLNEDRVNITFYVSSFFKSHPQWLHKKLAENEDYRMRFADRVYRHFFNEGVIQPERLTEIFMKTANAINLAIIAESARWGDLQRSKHNAWEPAINEIVIGFFPYRSEIVLDQFRTADLYPNIEPPVFWFESQEITRSSFPISSGFKLSLTNPNGNEGTIYYTLDGSDPRLIGGGVSSTAHQADDGQAIDISVTTLLKARIKANDVWSALHEVLLFTDDDLNGLRITEIHYHPLDQGTTDGKNFEFLELYSAGSNVLNLSQSRFISGVDYVFPAGTVLNVGQYLVLASNLTDFEERYKFRPFGQYQGQLDNAGEQLVLANPEGDSLIVINYSDQAPWPVEADGAGYSLVWTDALGDDDQNNPLNWKASRKVHGSPGFDDAVESVSGSDWSLPRKFQLYSNYPNPFNSSTTIGFDVPLAVQVRLTIYDLLGRTVEILVNKKFVPGHYTVRWNTADQSAGLYFYRIQAGEFTRTGKMLLVK